MGALQENGMDRQKQTPLDRRGFLKLASVTLGGVLLRPPAEAFASERGKDELAILYDASRCIGCGECERACKAYNDLPAESSSPTELSAVTWNLIRQRPGVGREEHPFFLEQCMHCSDPACVAVCTTGALQQDERGFVAFDADLCNGCGYCTQFCPFGVPQLDQASLVTGEARAAKCTFCQEKVEAGTGGPSCAEACPTGALSWGKRDALIDKAEARVAELHAEGVRGAMLYGLAEAGGLHRLSILLDVPPAYGLPTAPETPVVFAKVWQRVIQPMGGFAVGVTGLGLVINWLVARTQIKAEEL
jgi:formate dehydrogenase iron-sulfur subunit